MSGYRRELGAFSAAMLIAGSMIGSGIFLAPAETVRLGHTASFLMGVWVFAGLLTLLGALSFGELAGLFPEAGGPYVFLREAWGPLPAFLFGWTTFLVIDSGGIAAVAAGFGKYLGAFLPWASDGRWLLGPWHIPGIQAGPIPLGPYDLGLTGSRLAGIAVILLLSAANMGGVRLGARIQNVLTVIKIGALLLLVGLSLTLRPAIPPAGSYSPLPGTPLLPLGAAFLVAQVGALFSADGGYYVTYVAAEVREPQRRLPMALVLGTLLIVALYVLANLGYLRLLGPAGIGGAPEDRVGSQALRAILGTAGEGLMAGGVMVSMFGYLNGAILTPARLYQAMAADGLFFRKAATLNAQGVPAAALAVQALWSCLLALSGTFDQLLDYVVFATLLFYALCVAGVLRLRRVRPSLERPYRVLGYPVVPILYLAGVASILGALLVYRPAFTWPGLLLIGLGIPVYGAARRSARKLPVGGRDAGDEAP
ncbi:MAG: amino acid permease [Acidobacteria bacterium]|nr:amino acid permease [Acidobacteriota bacterium]